ncbi:MAG: hypothetical protein AAFZ74_17905 [Pseudomonadota bacterium]
MIEPMDILLGRDNERGHDTSHDDAHTLRRSVLRLTLVLYMMAGLMVTSAMIWLAAITGLLPTASSTLVWGTGATTMALMSIALWIEQKYTAATSALAERALPSPR